MVGPIRPPGPSPFLVQSAPLVLVPSLSGPIRPPGPSPPLWSNPLDVRSLTVVRTPTGPLSYSFTHVVCAFTLDVRRGPLLHFISAMVRFHAEQESGP